MKCPYCGAETSGNSCEYCGSQLSERQEQKVRCNKCGSTNVTFKRENQGEVRGKNAKQIVHKTVGMCKDCGNTWYIGEAQTKVKKRKTWLWVLGWLFIFPVPLTILMLKNRKLKPGIRYGIIAAAWIVYLIIALAGGAGNNTNNTDTRALSDDKSESADNAPAPAPIEVTEINISSSSEELPLGGNITLSASVLPVDADNQAISWSSSNKEIADVNKDGLVSAVGGGTVTITATASNGVSASKELTVDGSKKVMHLNFTRIRQNTDVNIGDEWSHIAEVNDDRVAKEYILSVGDTLSFYAKSTESDENPDIGEASASHTVTEEDYQNGFTVSMDVYVTENGGRNSGTSAHFVYTFVFST